MEKKVQFPGPERETPTAKPSSGVAGSTQELPEYACCGNCAHSFVERNPTYGRVQCTRFLPYPREIGEGALCKSWEKEA